MISLFYQLFGGIAKELLSRMETKTGPEEIPVPLPPLPLDDETEGCAC